jgi:hypothetical protein
MYYTITANKDILNLVNCEITIKELNFVFFGVSMILFRHHSEKVENQWFSQMVCWAVKKTVKENEGIKLDFLSI